jgi:Calpain family cysteine protease
MSKSLQSTSVLQTATRTISTDRTTAIIPALRDQLPLPSYVRNANDRFDSGNIRFVGDRYGDTLDTAGNILARANGQGWQIQDAVGGTDKIDTFRFDLPLYDLGGSNLHISLAGSAEVRLIRDFNGNRLLDDGEVVASANTFSGFDATIDRSAMMFGEYYLQVQNWDNNSLNYDLQVSYEKFNDRLGKERIFANSTIVSGFIDSNNASDSYHFSLDRTQNFNLNLRGVTATTDFRLVSDGNNNGRIDDGEILVDYYYQGATTQPITLIHQQLGAGNYFLQVNQSNLYQGSSQYEIMMGCDWFTNNLSDDAIMNTARATYIPDSKISHQDLIDVMRSAKDDGAIDAVELRDLKAIVAHGDTLWMPKATQVLAGKVWHPNLANLKSGIDGFGAGSSAEHLEKLIGKWFLGRDRPGIPDVITSVTVSWDSGLPLPVYHHNPIAYQWSEGSLFQDGISYLDVDQGKLGDCYFLASLGAVALHTPNRIANMFTDNGNGTFAVRFFVNGQENYVTVDRFLPTYSTGTFVYANNSSGLGHWDARNELWVALAEKAYAQINQEDLGLLFPGGIGQDGTNTYAGIAGGWATDALTHITGLSTMPRQDLSSGALFWASNTVLEMLTAFNQGRMVVVNTTRPDNADVVVENHAYTLTGYDANTGQFSLYNPWKSGPILYRTVSQLMDDFDSWDATTAA